MSLVPFHEYKYLYLFWSVPEGSLTEYRDGMQPGLHGLQSSLVVGEAVSQANVCKKQYLFVFRDVVHGCQRLHDL